MKESKSARSEDDRNPQHRTTTEKEGGEDSASSTSKPKYEFKILPVDPKNNFDFEDVADK